MYNRQTIVYLTSVPPLWTPRVSPRRKHIFHGGISFLPERKHAAKATNEQTNRWIASLRKAPAGLKKLKTFVEAKLMRMYNVLKRRLHIKLHASINSSAANAIFSDECTL